MIHRLALASVLLAVVGTADIDCAAAESRVYAYEAVPFGHHVEDRSSSADGLAFDRLLPAAATKRQACLVRCANEKKSCDNEANPNHPQCRKEWQACEKQCPK
jgi:hypothetical protein